MRYVITAIIMLALSILCVGLLLLIFTVPDEPQIGSLDEEQQKLQAHCYQGEASHLAIDNQGEFEVLVWNIHKQSTVGWQQELQRLSQTSQLILLQEASISREFTDWLASQSWGANYVNAFRVFDVSAGVLNLATQMPTQACAYLAVEPWMRLPKSALYAKYQLSDGQELAVINLHAINFTLGTQDYNLQIAALKQAVEQHKGPLIIAGDFNTWSQQRMEQLSAAMRQMSLQEVVFEPDNRRRFWNELALDHVFFRGLALQRAQAPTTHFSDHNPMQVQFKLLPSESHINSAHSAIDTSYKSNP